jgi:predicted DNA binding CopG/RHH family protein
LDTGGAYSNAYRLISREEVSQIAKKEASGAKRVNVNIEINLHNAFKAATAAKGTDMTTVLQEYIESYVAKYGPATPKKGRRG